MSVQQCLACNAVVPRSSKSCQCGHVFENVRQIAGKRFSEYRAELYWRLESKRMKALSKENTPFVNEVTSADQNNNVDKDNKGSNKEADKKPAARLTQLSRKRIFQRRVKGLHSASKGHHKPSPLTYSYVQHSSDKTVSPEELRRFSKALEEINKKIHSQNLVWKSLL
ncbi:hypothetical protein ACROYT_G007256 [Oculina patagonica]